MARPYAIVFDAFGTLFDVGGIQTACEAVFPGHGAALSRLWREKQLAYSWLRSLMDRYADFEQVTAEALTAVCWQLGLGSAVAHARDLVALYSTLPPHADVPDGLAALHRAGCKLAILSNGTNAQLVAVVEHANLGVPFHILSADEVGIYKPDPRVYALIAARLGVATSEAVFVSSNAWDVAGALAFGLHTAWIRRTDAVYEEIGPAPTWQEPSLVGVAERLGASG